ncbi:MAG TPA: hypothetical protein VNL77_13005 [Roseiflexaceae bacterium]|nr:hypothetical protein [Roseiflexaceae bacterium]
MDSIRLINQRGGMPPRFYILSGADRRTLTEAVRALPFHRFIPDERGGAFLVRLESLEALQARGLTVRREDADEHVVGAAPR